MDFMANFADQHKTHNSDNGYWTFNTDFQGLVYIVKHGQMMLYTTFHPEFTNSCTYGLYHIRFTTADVIDGRSLIIDHPVSNLDDRKLIVYWHSEM